MNYLENVKKGSLEEWLPLKVPLYDGQNIINTSKTKKIGVLELSSRAVKLLVSDQKMIDKMGFDFEYFYRKGYLTQTVNGLNDKAELDIDYFERQVLPVIIKQVEKATYLGVNVLYVVATAVYRKACNKLEVIHLIEQKANIRVKVLSQEEEALLTLEAFMFSGAKYMRKRKDLLLIDQGGGSTEILKYNKKEHTLLNYSLGLGTNLLKETFFVKSKADRNIEKSFYYYNEYIKKEISSKLCELDGYNSRNLQCVGLGTAMTKATNEVGNKNQHGKVLTRKDLFRKVNYAQKIICSKFRTVGELIAYFDGSDLDVEKLYYEELLLMRLGLSMTIEIMKKFNLYNITISGTGLWYGVYYESVKH